MFPEPSKWSLSLVHSSTQSWGRLLIWQLPRRQSLTPFTRRVSHKHSLPKKLAFHRVLYPSMLTESWVEGKSVEEKRCTTNRENRSLMRIVKQNRFKKLGELHKEWTEAGVKASRATTHRRVKEFGYSCHQRRLTWAKRRRTGLLPSGPKSSFQMRASLVFHLETKVLESGGSVEKLIAQVAWSPVLSFHSLWWFGVQCHLLVLVHCVFWKQTSLHPFTKKLWRTSCFLLLTSFLKMLISFSIRIWHLPTLPKAPKVG